MNGIKIIELKDKIFQDERGWIVNPLEIANLQTKSFHHFHIVSMKPGSIRGNHYHTGAKEWLFVCEGEALISWRNIEEKTLSHNISEGNPILFEINEKVAHAIKNISENEIFLISFSDSEKRETHRCSSLFHSDIN